MRVIPVIDLKSGQVVRAVAGQREEYQPIRSLLVASSDPASVAQQFIRAFDCHEIYVADIDALRGRPLNLHAIQQIIDTGIKVWLDVGVCQIADWQKLESDLIAPAASVSVILGSESVRGATALAECLGALSPDRAIFSLDLKNHQPLSANFWGDQSPEQILDAVVSFGVKKSIVLDLARVGVSGGCGTVELCRQFRQRHPSVELFAGGGVRGWQDLHELHLAGCQGALVATALHSGELTLDDLTTAKKW